MPNDGQYWKCRRQARTWRSYFKRRVHDLQRPSRAPHRRQLSQPAKYAGFTIINQIWWKLHELY